MNKLLIFIVLPLVLTTSSCEKEYAIPTPPEKLFEVSINTEYNFQPFYFENDYFINSSKVRISFISFPLTITSSENVTLSEITTNNDYLFRYVKFPNDSLYEAVLGFYELESESYLVYIGSGMEQTTETRTVITKVGNFRMNGRVDIDDDGILETSFDFFVPIGSLDMSKYIGTISMVDRLELSFDIQKLLEGVDLKKVDRISTQYQIAENLPMAFN